MADPSPLPAPSASASQRRLRHEVLRCFLSSSDPYVSASTEPSASSRSSSCAGPSLALSCGSSWTPSTADQLSRCAMCLAPPSLRVLDCRRGSVTCLRCGCAGFAWERAVAASSSSSAAQHSFSGTSDAATLDRALGAAGADLVRARHRRAAVELAAGGDVRIAELATKILEVWASQRERLRGLEKVAEACVEAAREILKRKARGEARGKEIPTFRCEKCRTNFACRKDVRVHKCSPVLARRQKQQPQNSEQPPKTQQEPGKIESRAPHVHGIEAGNMVVGKSVKGPKAPPLSSKGTIGMLLAGVRTTTTSSTSSETRARTASIIQGSQTSSDPLKTIQNLGQSMEGDKPEKKDTSGVMRTTAEETEPSSLPLSSSSSSSLLFQAANLSNSSSTPSSPPQLSSSPEMEPHKDQNGITASLPSPEEIQSPSGTDMVSSVTGDEETTKLDGTDVHSQVPPRDPLLAAAPGSLKRKLMDTSAPNTKSNSVLGGTLKSTQPSSTAPPLSTAAALSSKARATRKPAASKARAKTKKLRTRC